MQQQNKRRGRPKREVEVMAEEPKAVITREVYGFEAMKINILEALMDSREKIRNLGASRELDIVCIKLDTAINVFEQTKEPING